MLLYILKRLFVAFLVAVTVSIVTFSLVRSAGDPAVAIAGPDAAQEDVERIRVQYGLDRPIIIQYGEWAGKAIRGDFGYSRFLNTEVSKVVLDRLPVTLTLGALSISFALLLAIPLGVLAACYPNTILDRIALTISVVGQALPSFWFALILMVFFGVHWSLFPVSGSSTMLHFVLPSIALGYYASPAIMRLTRAGMLEVLASDYIRTARAKGLLQGSILFKHALRNAVIPVVSVAAVQLGFMFGGSIVIETIFSLNGLGQLAWQSIHRADLDTMQAVILINAAMYIIATLAADILNAALDPRIRVN
ncbi:MAG: ABC transporter permease [Salinarimonadaceae bacterium]|nr:MAG: ABC transporter permease [Salinarimonadaceae bacterium]